MVDELRKELLEQMMRVRLGAKHFTLEKDSDYADNMLLPWLQRKIRLAEIAARLYQLERQPHEMTWVDHNSAAENILGEYVCRTCVDKDALTSEQEALLKEIKQGAT